ncbi:Auxin-induced protein [Macleaya cordata]|uniref:Auxin-induced protein n=1 Tax=Macleaya cordata TaxID=56857 RepID=A0A200QQ90_MACCD|nr:Auxin-induced protein [Macleaya cordata]
MSAGFGKCSKIRHIVRLRQMLRRWRLKASSASRLTSGGGGRIPSDVPAGHVAVTVGTSCRRFVVRATYLNHPVFKKLLIQAEEEYGFTNHGPLTIPCDESVFEEILLYISRPESYNNSARLVHLEDFQRYCHVGLRANFDFWPESRPLLHGLAEKSIW